MAEAGTNYETIPSNPSNGETEMPKLLVCHSSIEDRNGKILRLQFWPDSGDWLVEWFDYTDGTLYENAIKSIRGLACKISRTWKIR